MNVYICYRFTPGNGEAWMGALIIAAPTPDMAQDIFRVHPDSAGEPPKFLSKLEDVAAIGKPRVLYDDSMR